MAWLLFSPWLPQASHLLQTSFTAFGNMSSGISLKFSLCSSKSLHYLRKRIASDECMGSGAQDRAIPLLGNHSLEKSQRFNYTAVLCSDFSKTPSYRQLARSSMLCPCGGTLGSHSSQAHFQGNMPTLFQPQSSCTPACTV